MNVWVHRQSYEVRPRRISGGENELSFDAWLLNFVPPSGQFPDLGRSVARRNSPPSSEPTKIDMCNFRKRAQGLDRHFNRAFDPLIQLFRGHSNSRC